MNNVKTIVVPYSIPRPNTAFDLISEPAELLFGDNKFEQTVDIVFRPLPIPRVVLEFHWEPTPMYFVRKMGPKDFQPTVHFVNRGFSRKMHVLRVRSGENAVLELTPVSEPDSTQSDLEIANLTFHILNFAEFRRREIVQTPGKKDSIRGVPNDLRLEADGWRVDIGPFDKTSENAQLLREEGGYAVTHVGDLRRSNGAPFSTTQTSEVLWTLQYFFSFVCGFWASPNLGIGFDRSEKPVWHEIDLRYLDPWQAVLSWFDPQYANWLPKLFPGFVALWNTETWQTAIKAGIYWYIRSNTLKAGTDGSLILSQAALERLATAYAQATSCLSNEGFKKLDAADKLRLILGSLKIPLDVPESLSELSKLAKKWNWEDGAAAVTILRNSAVHPEPERWKKYSDGSFDAWNLAQWYIEMILLRLCNYHGEYSSRLLVQQPTRILPVPWNITWEK